MKEKWKWIKGYKHLYAVSNKGHVLSVERVVMRKNGAPLTVPAKIRKQPVDAYGYPHVSLSKDGVVITRQVYRLVARAFHGKCPPGMEVSHKNGNKLDSREKNLVYETRAENNQRKVEHGTDHNGERAPAAKLTWKQVRKMRKLYRLGHYTQTALGEMYGVSGAHVCSIINGVHWKPEHDPKLAH